MRHELIGTAALKDIDNAVTLGGRLTLRSDGQSRSEIVIGDPDGGRMESIVFSRGSTWVPVYHLIQVIRDLYYAESLEANVDSDDPCSLCHGYGGFEDDEGNWRDCGQCVP